MEHTKGKWMIGKAGKYHWQIIADIPSKVMIPGQGIRQEVDTFICDLTAGEFQEPKEYEANANLIAAAPMLLEALERFVESSHCQNNCKPDDMTCDTMFAKKAINKAKGE